MDEHDINANIGSGQLEPGVSLVRQIVLLTEAGRVWGPREGDDSIEDIRSITYSNGYRHGPDRRADAAQGYQAGYARSCRREAPTASP